MWTIQKMELNVLNSDMILLGEVIELSEKYKEQIECLEKISGLDYLHVYSHYSDMKIFVDVFLNQNKMLNKSNPDYACRLDILGVYYCWIEKDRKKAKDMWLHSVGLNNPVAHYNLGTFYRLFPSDNSNINISTQELVIKHYNHAIEFGIRYSYINLGSFYEKIGDDEKAIESYTLAVACGLTNGLILLGYLYLKKNDYQKAEEYFMDGIHKTGDANAIMCMAAIHFSKKNFQTALNYVLMVSDQKIHAENVDPSHETMVVILLNLKKDLENTIDEYKSFDPDNWFCNVYKSFCEVREKKQLIDNYSSNIGETDIQTIVTAGDYYMKNNYIDQAIQCFTVAIEKGDKLGIVCTYAHGQLGTYYINLQDYTRAYFHLDKSYKNGNMDALEDLLIVITEHLGELERFELLLDICRKIVFEVQTDNHRVLYCVIKRHITSLMEWKILNKLEEENGTIDNYFINVRKSLENLSHVEKFKRRYSRAVFFQTKSQCIVCFEENTLNIEIDCGRHGVCYQCWGLSSDCPYRCKKLN